MGDFTRTDVETLLGQHTAETGQGFAPGAVRALWEQTRGQPWLVNALALEMCFSSGMPKESGAPFAERDVFEAREALILRRETHLDQLADKLREPRVRRVIEPLLAGGDAEYGERDFEYVRDLGLVAPGRTLRVANPIYGEVLPRELTSVLQHEIAPQETAWYVRPDGGLDMNGLLAAFQDFFRQNSEHWIRRAQYTEAGPQLVLQAFLHRVVNATGRIEREYALGSRRVDLLVVWPRERGREDRIVVECKLVRVGRSLSRTVDEGLEQTRRYMDISGTDEGHLVVFDMRPDRSWAERVFREERDRRARGSRSGGLDGRPWPASCLTRAVWRGHHPAWSVTTLLPPADYMVTLRARGYLPTDVFTHANDLWKVARDGGDAIRLTSSEGRRNLSRGSRR